MKAVFFDQNLTVIDLPKPNFSGDESVVRLIRAGICNTDLEIIKGYFGFKGVLGHEFVGRVEASRTSTLVGARVVGEINAACHECDACRIGWTRHCPHRSVLGILNRNGAFSEFLTLPEQNLHRVPDSVSDDEAVFIEPIAAACEILEQVKLQLTDNIAVLGDGKLGLLITMVLAQAIQSTSDKLTLIGKHPNKMKILKHLGVQLINYHSLKPCSYFDLVVEATGSPEGLALALRLIKPRGTIVLKSTFHSRLTFDPAALVVDEITLVGSRCGRFEPALELLKQRRIDPTLLVQDTLPLNQALTAFELAKQPEVLKVLLEP